MKKHIALLRVAVLATILIYSSLAQGQTPHREKLSPLVREALLSVSTPGLRAKAVGAKTDTPQWLTAFVQTSGGEASALREEGCRVLSTVGNIHIVAIPLERLSAVASQSDVLRIEASESCMVTMDSTTQHVDALPVYAGTGLPQAYTGRGVVMGLMDIGFDLTHPTFYSKDMSEYRIKALWDQLSTDTVGSPFYVGRDYVGRDALLALGCTRDGQIATHGTHTAGIAAGSGYDSKYQGMAYESDLCLVANYTSADRSLVGNDRYKYTSATDALGFQYIFDYAAQQGQPCVISFSEGYRPDFYGEDMLYYAVLDSLTGPGRILCASAGNESVYKSYFRKARGEESQGAFLISSTSSAIGLLRSRDDFDVRLVFYGEQNDTLMISSSSVCMAPDSMRMDTLQLASGQYRTIMAAYPSCYDAADTGYELLVYGPQEYLGYDVAVSMELVGKEADVEWFRYSGYIIADELNLSLTAGEPSHNIHAPAAAPCVIAVGANSYRKGVTNWQGQWQSYDQGTDGEWAPYSSVGPALDGNVKPDVVAPGTNIISAYSSYYIAANPTAADVAWDVAHFSYGDRTYAWNSNSGTSMATPVVGGAIALWLEANPQLTPDDCKRIFRKTCRQTDGTMSYPNNYYGYGEIDVYAGLLEALDLLATIPDLSAHQPEAVTFSLAGEELQIAAANEKPLAVRVYTTSGQLLLSRTLSGAAEYQVSLAGMPRGVLAVQVSGSTAAETGSTLVRHD